MAFKKELALDYCSVKFHECSILIIGDSRFFYRILENTVHQRGTSFAQWCSGKYMLQRFSGKTNAEERFHTVKDIQHGALIKTILQHM